MPWDDEQWGWDRLPGGPRGFRSCATTETADEVRRWRADAPKQTQRMNLRDLARMGMVMAKEEGKTILQIVEEVARGEKRLPSQQMSAAIAALPYRHARLANTTVTHRDELSDLDGDELRALLALAKQLEREEAAANGRAAADDMGAGEPSPQLPPLH